MRLRIAHQLKKLRNPLYIECVQNCPTCEAHTKVQQVLDPKCVSYIWIPARHITDAKSISGPVDLKKAITLFLKELDLI